MSAWPHPIKQSLIMGQSQTISFFSIPLHSSPSVSYSLALHSVISSYDQILWRRTKVFQSKHKTADNQCNYPVCVRVCLENIPAKFLPHSWSHLADWPVGKQRKQDWLEQMLIASTALKKQSEWSRPNNTSLKLIHPQHIYFQFDQTSPNAPSLPYFMWSVGAERGGLWTWKWKA